MFCIYRHNEHPEYRLIAPKGVDLPPELRDEWTLCDMTDHVEAEQEEDITKSGYHLYRCSSEPR
jgi:hypothetical protein